MQAERIKPFWTEKSCPKKEKPFTIQPDPESVLEKDKMEEKKVGVDISDNQLPKQRIPPFYRIAEGTEALAKIICDSCLPVIGDMTSVLPYVEVALEQCRRAGQQLPILLPGSMKSEVGMLNFRLKLLGRTMTIYDTEQGEKTENSYKIQVAVASRRGILKNFQALVAGDKVKGVDWLKKATCSLATLPKGKEEQIEYQQLVQDCIETEGVTEEFLYPRAGWRDVPGYGWRYIYSGGMIGGSYMARTLSDIYTLDLNETQLGERKTFYLAIQMMNICHNHIACTELFLYVHAAALRTLFEKSGHPLEFVFGIMGVTNSRKTSLALAMAKLFNRESLVADAEFATATGCGIEKTLSTYGDSVVIVDDFKPGVNQAQQKDMDRKLDELVRFYGNRVSKKRMLDFAPDGDKKFFPVGGGCVLTMEILTGIPSSLTRMFITELGLKDIDNEKLQRYQEETWILPTHMYDFLSWVTEEFDKIIGYIREIYPILRRQYSCEIGRYSEMYALMLTTAKVFKFYGVSRNYWDEALSEAFVEQMDIIITEELERMEDRFRRSDKGQVIIQAFIDAVRGSLMVPLILNVENSARKEAFYEDESFYYIQVRALRQVVNEYCRKYHERIEFVSDDEMLGLLEKLGVLEVMEKAGRRERSRKLPIQRWNAKRYLYLNKNKLIEMENN